MERLFGCKKKTGFSRIRYLITMIDNHDYILLHHEAGCQHIVAMAPISAIYCAS
jgi:hypothetical protein